MSRLVVCGDCGAEISKQAKACPRCGRPNRADSQLGRGSLIAASVVVFGFLFVVSLLKKPGDDPDIRVVALPPEAPQPIAPAIPTPASTSGLGPPAEPTPIRPNGNAQVVASGAWLVPNDAIRDTWEAACRAEDTGDRERLEAMERRGRIVRLRPGARLLVGEVGPSWCDVLTRNMMEKRHAGRVRLDRVAAMGD